MMEKTAFSYRPVTLEDLPALVELEKKTQPSPWNEEHFKGEMQKPYSQVLVLTDDETDKIIAGFVVFWMMFDECQILNLAVDVPYRGRGLGKQMLQRVVSSALKKSLKRVALEVRKSNAPAIQLYQGVGFAITHVRKSFYSNGEDAYQMTLFLDENIVRF
jgi:[ribosomal protein S18]-alanine N-acetyltransferase